ncbi:MAG: hypothetical protein K6F81_03940 [Acholeplasmatales bacterium]|nr:hypothetical protein [Acholeplasmatales bacterium]
MKKKNYKITSLISLYLNYIFQKTTLIVLLISLFLMITILVVIANPSLSDTDYLLGFKDIHNAYFEQSLFVIQVFNSIIVTTVVITIIINSISFDSLFVSYVPRYIICISKLCAILIIMFGIILFEVMIVYLIPLLKYDLYRTSIENFSLLGYLLLTTFFELMLEVFLSTLIPTIFVPMSFLFIFIVMKAIMHSLNRVKDIISSFIPVIETSDSIYTSNGILVGMIWIILLSFLYFSIYNVKDLKII